MAEAQRLSVWGWFIRAFAGGVGAMFGVMTALVFACVVCYVLFAVCMTALSSFGAIGFEQPIVIGDVRASPIAESTPAATQFLPAQAVPAQYYPASAGYSNPYADLAQPAAYSNPFNDGAQPAANSEPQASSAPYEPAQAALSIEEATDAN